MVDFAHLMQVRGRSAGDPQDAGAPWDGTLTPLTSMAVEPWSMLARQAIEPNAYHLPDWKLAVNATAPGRTDVSTLSAWSDPADALQATPDLIGLLPVVSLWRAYHLPLPALASADPYGTLGTPLLHRAATRDAVMRLLQQARNCGARALILRDMSLRGTAMTAIDSVLNEAGLAPCVLQSTVRALLDATCDADQLLRDALGSKKLKELRRQRHRLAEHGDVRFEVARTPQQVTSAIDVFLKLEASGWKGKRGTALLQRGGDAAFIRRAAIALAERGQCEIVTLHAGETPVAAAVVPRHQDRAYFFKIGINEDFAKLSPGVQLTLDLTRHLCADPEIISADSTASPDHPMIDRIWRGRLAIGDVLVPLRSRDPVVPIIHAALMLRQFVRGTLRRAVRMLHLRD